ncbi:hypothetical protein ACET3Z_013340 [Daucus carota]
MEEKVDKKVRDNVKLLMSKLAEKIPELKLNIVELTVAVPNASAPEASDAEVFLKTRKRNPKNEYKSDTAVMNYRLELTSQIRQNLEVEIEAKVKKDVQEEVDSKLAVVLKKLSEANPNLQINLGDLCATISSDNDNGTPLTRDASS